MISLYCVHIKRKFITQQLESYIININRKDLSDTVLSNVL